MPEFPNNISTCASTYLLTKANGNSIDNWNSFLNYDDNTRQLIIYTQNPRLKGTY